MEWILLCGGAFLAGLVDAVVGGGGLIQIPLLFSALPQAPASTLFGTNKLSSVFGTGIAALRYTRRVTIPWRTVMPAALAAFALSYAGALTVVRLPPAFLRPLVLVLLILVATYTLFRKEFGATDQNRAHRRRDSIIALLLGGLIGFYDGFFGPGAGSFLIFLFIRFFGLDFLRASASAKIVNVSTNIAALLYFGSGDHVFWQLGFAMAISNVTGSILGSHLTLRHGSRFVRRIFLLVVGTLIVKFAYDTFAGGKG